MDEIKLIGELQLKAQKSFKLLIDNIKGLQIGDNKKFPFGWRKSAKGRTVWRLVEELITQNLEKNCTDFGISEIKISDSEVSVHDMMCKFDGYNTPVYFNIKSAVKGGKSNTDDLSKAEGLIKFYEEDINKHYFIATFVISFNSDMTIGLEDVIVFPLSWIPDIYINPSNNGNMQSSKYKDIKTAIKRDNKTFYGEFLKAYEIAKIKKKNKQTN